MEVRKQGPIVCFGGRCQSTHALPPTLSPLPPSSLPPASSPAGFPSYIRRLAQHNLESLPLKPRPIPIHLLAVVMFGLGLAWLWLKPLLELQIYRCCILPYKSCVDNRDRITQMVKIKEQNKLWFKMATRRCVCSTQSHGLKPWLWLRRPQAKAKALSKPRVRLGLAWSSRGFGLGAWGLKAKPSTSLSGSDRDLKYYLRRAETHRKSGKALALEAPYAASSSTSAPSGSIWNALLLNTHTPPH
ncbi:hypothetical protein DFH07DRAFT_1022113 [Mycena maculata]|uniref:Uncharacterized protein n=1 Tax=Mycena maculata TaxID=230809 RepID=A0AAD7NHL3_9AGAR|nr:hypothetical protein DFH07DRAFT_1022113 [Mycena maculata]